MALVVHPPQTSDRGHAPISPSASSRWLKCPWSLILPGDPGYGTAPDENSRAAELGTIQHAAIEDAVRTNNIEGPVAIIRSLRIDDGLIRQAWADFHDVAERFDIGQVWLETTVEPLDRLGDIFFGTSDCIGLSRDGSTLVVLDYKFGKWPVKVKSNTQVLIYGRGGVRHVQGLGFSPTRIVGAISQPALPVSLSAWEIESNTWDEFANDLNAVLDSRLAGRDGLAPVPGSHCSFCPVKGSCPAHESGGATFDDLDLGEVDFD